MAFKGEDGSGLRDANAQITVEVADEYFALRNNTKWAAANDATKQGCIVIATDFIIEQFGRKFRGIPMISTQAMPFPRLTMGVPADVIKAVCELASEALARGNLWNNPDPSQGQQTERTVGPLTDKWEPAAVTNLGSTQRRYERVRNILAAYLADDTGGGSMVLRTRRV